MVVMAVASRIVVLSTALSIAFGCRRSPPPSPTSSSSTSSNLATSASSTPAPSTSASIASAPPDPCRIGGGRVPLLARWSIDERAAVAHAMEAGLAIVSADDCHGVRLLPECHARGRYGSNVAAPRKSVIVLSTDEELRVNAPLARPDDAAGPLPLRVPLSVTAYRTTTRHQLDPDELTGDCSGATHWIAIASTGDDGVAHGAIVELHVEPIQKIDDVMSWDHAPEGTKEPIGMCPRDMVVSNWHCVRSPGDAPFLCNFGDAAQCRKECELGDVNSCDVLGFMHWHGNGVPVDFAAAAKLYDANCRRDDFIACANLGDFTFQGLGVVKDPAKATQLYDRACKLGDGGACASLALATIAGTGVATDVAHGTAILERSCDGASAAACEGLARSILAGKVKGDAARARSILTDLCDGDNAAPCREIGRITYVGEGVTPDPSRAATLFEKACRLGSDDSCVLLGLMYRQGDGVARDDVRATRILAYACARGFQEGCFNLGIAYENGKGVTADRTRAAALYKQACDGKVARACFFLGDLTDDPAQAHALYVQACALGEPEACAKK
jgi:TPR repeat protein